MWVIYYETGSLCDEFDRMGKNRKYRHIGAVRCVCVCVSQIVKWANRLLSETTETFLFPRLFKKSKMKCFFILYKMKNPWFVHKLDDDLKCLNYLWKWPAYQDNELFQAGGSNPPRVDQLSS